MDIRELQSFQLSDAVKFHDHLNPKIFHGQHVRPEVEKQLKIIAGDFLEELGVNGLDVQDITISGSNAAYSYTSHSDLDLHILVDMTKLHDDDMYRELFTAKKNAYNDSHNIKIHGIPVELYIQDSNEPVISLGEYSIKNNKWLKIPSKRRANFDQTATRKKYEKLIEVIQRALKTQKLDRVQNVIQTIKRYRQAGLDKGGEFGPENLAYKALRSQGYITQLYKLRDELHSKELSIEGMYAENNKLAKKPAPTIEQLVIKYKVPKQDILIQLDKGIKVELQSTKDRSDARELALNNIGRDPHYYNRIHKIKLKDSEDYEIHNYIKLDKILKKLCEMVIGGQESDKDYGMVGACVLDPDNKIVAGLNTPGDSGKRVHAERVAVEKYEKKYGIVPPGSIVITTLSPCNEADDDTAENRDGESCTEYLNDKGIKKVYCGYIDPTQDNDIRQFNLIETSNQDIRELCKRFADTFLNTDEEQITDEDYNPNGPPPGPEFKPTMPAGTVKVDVSDVYDWYKLGQHISNLKGLGQHDFGSGPPSTILSFGDEDTEHEYINDLEKTGLTTTDIDPVDPNQPKGMKRQKTDPTYNVNEASGYIPSEKEKNDPRFKTALTVDVKPDSIKKNAKAFSWLTNRAGVPPTANPSGKF